MGLEMYLAPFKKLASCVCMCAGQGAIVTLTITVQQMVVGEGAVRAPAKVS